MFQEAPTGGWDIGEAAERLLGRGEFWVGCQVLLQLPDAAALLVNGSVVAEWQGEVHCCLRSIQLWKPGSAT